jgi:uncharacterized protein
MRIEETFVLGAPPAEALGFLSDVQRVAGCVPGVSELVERPDGSYEAVLAVKVGPISASFSGEVSLQVCTDPPSITANGRGSDRRSDSRAEVAFRADVAPEGSDGSRITTVADLTIRGRLGQFGTGVIRATASELIRDFVACADAALAGPTPQAEAAWQDDGGALPPAEPAAARGGRVGLRLMLRILRTWLRGLVGRGRDAGSAASGSDGA